MAHIHSNSEFDYTASGVIVRDNKVLLLLHHKLHMWFPPAGHIELDETPLEGLFREVEEESGLTPDNLTLVTPYTDNLRLERDTDKNITQPMPFDIDVHAIGDDGHRHIDFAYILISDTDKFTLEKDGATDMRWFTMEEIEALSPTNKTTKSRARYALRQVQEVQ